MIASEKFWIGQIFVKLFFLYENISHIMQLSIFNDSFLDNYTKCSIFYNFRQSLWNIAKIFAYEFYNWFCRRALAILLLLNFELMSLTQYSDQKVWNRDSHIFTQRRCIPTECLFKRFRNLEIFCEKKIDQNQCPMKNFIIFLEKYSNQI